MLDFLVGNNFLSSIIAFVIVLIPAVIIHELGHLFAAKAVGITVLEFGIGFPPRLIKLFTWGETEFTLNWIQLGGFVRPLGEDMIRPLSETEVERDRQQAISDAAKRDKHQETYLSEREELQARGIYRTKSVNEANPYQRILFMGAGALANFGSAFLIFVVIGLIGVPTFAGSRVFFADIPEDSVFAEIGLQDGDFIETLNGEYFANSRAFFVRLNELAGQEVTISGQRLSEDENEESQPLEFSFTPTTEQTAAFAEAQSYVLITQVMSGTPGEEAGLLSDDLVAAFNGDPITGEANPAQTLQQLAVEYAGQEITLTILRAGETLEVQLTPRLNPPPDSGRIGIGIQSLFTNPNHTFEFGEGGNQQTYEPQPLGSAVQFAGDRLGSVLTQIAQFPARLLRGDTQPEERRVVSVVGVSQWGGQILQESIKENQPIVILDYIALISIALGITNLLPIPALDGGRIMFVLLEIIRGRPISPEREGLVHLVGLIFLLSIGVIFIINDILNPITNLLP
ncbi:MAG: site-2 protease family protein [Chitinophagaceae bacterium]|nr:site-2 protease family protein [Anaerolineae bacterium]